MKMSYVKTILLLLITALFFQSCAKDESFENDVTIEELKGGGRNGQGGNNEGGNNNHQDDVNRMSNDIIIKWTDQMLYVEQYSTGMRPNASARALAYINLAAYETALPGMRNNISTTSQLVGLDIDTDRVPKRIDYGIALNTVYAEVLDHFMINLPQDKRESIEKFSTSQEELLLSKGNLSNELIDDSKSWGAYVANQIISYSQSDTKAEEQILAPQPSSYEPPTGDGYWTYSADPERALFPYWESVRTFVVSTNETTTIAPIQYSSVVGTPYHDEMIEAYNANNEAKTTDAEQLHIAEFWSDDVEHLMISPPARQFSIANQLIVKYDLNLAESLTLLVKLGFSMNDAAVSTWKYKYEHMVMRPSNYIHAFIDPDYQTNLYRLIYWPNPSFPGYPSGHSCFASAAGGLFIDFFGDQTNFTDRTHEEATAFQGEPRNYRKFSDMAEENAFSRIPLGVHIRMDCVEGLRLGYEISDGVNDLKLTRQPQ